MKKIIINLVLILIAITLASFDSLKSDQSDCLDLLFYFKINMTTTDINTAAGSIIFPSNAILTTKLINPYGCDDSAIDICAVGYSITQIVLVGLGQYRLKNGVLPTDYICFVRKSE